MLVLMYINKKQYKKHINVRKLINNDIYVEHDDVFIWGSEESKILYDKIIKFKNTHTIKLNFNYCKNVTILPSFWKIFVNNLDEEYIYYLFISNTKNLPDIDKSLLLRCIYRKHNPLTEEQIDEIYNN